MKNNFCKEPNVGITTKTPVQVGEAYQSNQELTLLYWPRGYRGILLPQRAQYPIIELRNIA